ncbi:hypothetical protein EDB89DRAFT_307070 [Lactarius sanguifluus]|nr:hypothetical protein EDB89DRAFT_307070 [Lactarius sanguifluus]
MTGYILGAVRDVYVALHQETDSVPTTWDPSLYSLCNVPGHRPDSAPHIHDDSASTTSARTVQHDTVALVPASLRYPDAPSSSVPVPLCAIASLTGVPTLDNVHPGHKNTIEGVHIPVTSPDPAATSASAIRDIVTLGITTPHPTPGTSPSAPPTSIASTSPPRTIACQHIADYHTSSDVLHLLSPSPASVLNKMLPTGPQSSSDSPVTISDHAFSLTESHSSPLASAAPNPSCPRLLSSVHSLDTAEGEGSVKATLPKDRDAPAPPSSMRVNIIATSDLPSQPPSPFPVPDVVIATPSLRSLGTENTGDHPPNQSYGQHGIV